MAAGTIEVLQRANAAVRSALIRFQPERASCSTIQGRDIAALRAEIRCAADCLGDLPATDTRDPALEQLITELCRNLETLKQTLPGFHSRLLAEHSRLAAAQTHSAAASAWVQASKETL